MSDVETQEAEAPSRQRLEFLPKETGAGPFFPSGMSTVEASIAGAPTLYERAEQAEASGELTAAGQSEVGPGEAGSSYDPGSETIDQVLAHVEQNPGERDSVLAAERAGKNRTTLINQLESR